LPERRARSKLPGRVDKAFAKLRGLDDRNDAEEDRQGLGLAREREQE
jgi:hypothetical protein